MKYMELANEFLAAELASEGLEKELRKMSTIFPWIDQDSESTYFELTIGALPSYMKNIELIASKTYARGLILISIYYDRCIYCLVNAGEGDQPLLDVRFPNVSRHGQGLLLNTYNDRDNNNDSYEESNNDEKGRERNEKREEKIVGGWKKLTLWHIIETSKNSPKEVINKVSSIIPKIKTINISTTNYEQTYCILKSQNNDPKGTPLQSIYHDVLFRFGSWCYAGRVQLTSSLSLSDIPYVIPALRMQQSRLDYYCDVSNFPLNSPYASALEYVKKILPLIEIHIVQSEESLKSLIDRLSNMGLGDSVTKWLEGDSNNSFFEFKISPPTELEE
jgi:hypothetical protein